MMLTLCITELCNQTFEESNILLAYYLLDRSVKYLIEEYIGHSLNMWEVGNYQILCFKMIIKTQLCIKRDQDQRAWHRLLTKETRLGNPWSNLNFVQRQLPLTGAFDILFFSTQEEDLEPLLQITSPDQESHNPLANISKFLITIKIRDRGGKY